MIELFSARLAVLCVIRKLTNVGENYIFTEINVHLSRPSINMFFPLKLHEICDFKMSYYMWKWHEKWKVRTNPPQLHKRGSHFRLLKTFSSLYCHIFYTLSTINMYYVCRWKHVFVLHLDETMFENNLWFHIQFHPFRWSIFAGMPKMWLFLIIISFKW